jgi:hypothetical protein
VEQYGVPFGSAKIGQISPSGVNYKEVYLNDNGEVNKVMDNVVEGILKILAMSHQATKWLAPKTSTTWESRTWSKIALTSGTKRDTISWILLSFAL